MARLWVISIVLVTSAVTFGAVATAHTGAAVFDVREASARGRAIRIEVAVSYGLDGDAADGAFLRALPVGPDGRERASVDLVRRPKGVYVLEMQADSVGRWTFQITSRLPPGNTVVQVDVDERQPAAQAPARSRAEDDDSRAWLLTVAAGAALVLLVGAALIGRRRRRNAGDHRP
jgi:hypothetical protein